MAGYTELELKTFEISNEHSDSSLSVTSLALISDLPSSQHSSEELCRLIQSKKLWLVSPGICRIQIIVYRHQYSMLSNSTEIDFGFLEHLADAICQCPSWSALGLTIKQEDIQYQPLYDGAPNLYFIVEHPQKTSVLLSPPHSPTARFNGIECLFRYQSDNPRTPHTGTKQSNMHKTNTDGCTPNAILQLQTPGLTSDVHEDTMAATYWEDPMTDRSMNQSQQQWEDVAHLAMMALNVTIGIKKRMRGLRLFHLDTRPSLLELAPAIWNAHYLKATTFHVAQFPVISNILAASSQSQSTTLRQKSKRLLIDDDSRYDLPAYTETGTNLNTYRCSIERRLWDLVQTSLNPTTRTGNVRRDIHPQWGEFPSNPFIFLPLEVDNLDRFEYGSPVDELEGIDLGNAPNGGFPVHDFLGHPLQDNGNESDTSTEHQQWWYENQDMGAMDEDPPLEATDEAEETNYSPYFHLNSSLHNQSSSSERSYSTLPFQRYVPNNFQDYVMDIEDLRTPDNFRDIETIYDSIEELPLSQEAVIKEESQQETVYGGRNDIIEPARGFPDGDFYVKKEELDSQGINV